MSISNEALQKVSHRRNCQRSSCPSPSSDILQLVQEIETQAIAAQQQISVVKNQITVKQRDIRLLELTTTEISTLPRDTNVYEGVGKM